jgi:hypothetical protein
MHHAASRRHQDALARLVEARDRSATLRVGTARRVVGRLGWQQRRPLLGLAQVLQVDGPRGTLRLHARQAEVAIARVQHRQVHRHP